jgi:GT2 family glycosyltransferase
MTYGPFTPDLDGQPFPAPSQVEKDFASMQRVGIDCLRTYHCPPDWFLERANAHKLHVLIDVPWPKHVCFLESAHDRRAVRQTIRETAERTHSHDCVLAYSIGNEIPPDIVRWHGARRVERFLNELADVARQADPERLVTYANYPPTEYLDLSFLDFVTFNVFLHDLETFRRYLSRLQNLVGELPLVLGEIGMDTYRQGEAAQARFLAGHAREALLMGVAGIFIFSWTDDWHTGGYAIENWAFGITRADRSPKASYHSLGRVFQNASAPAELLSETPRVSVVVCSHNGGRTLAQCLRSLSALDYPNYEVILVDDGSTDETAAIVRNFPEVRWIRQTHQGLSVARNVGLAAAPGSIIAYTDSDCYADEEWLTHLVYQLQHSGAAAVGGPNLSPEDGRLAACIAASPGQPTHVLESDQVAEHIPGCNMAFRREALEAINGFDPQFWTAGDDVDVCWRLQQAGMWITFAPGAVVWHHRRPSVASYFRQQAGYGKAEALLRFKHPDRFNNRGDGIWRGVLYRPSRQILRLTQPVVYRGTFGTAPFQCLYDSGSPHWAMLPATLEWHFVALITALAAFVWTPVWLGVTVAMLGLSVAVAMGQAAEAYVARKHEGFASRLLIGALCYAQPLVRSWWRYATRLFSYRLPSRNAVSGQARAESMPLRGTHAIAYWSENGCDRGLFLRQLIAYLDKQQWGKTLDSGWSDWDLQIHCSPLAVVQVCTAQEEHGDGKRLVRVRGRLRVIGAAVAMGTVLLLIIAMAAGFPRLIALGGILALLATYGALWWHARQRASLILAMVNHVAGDLGLTLCPPVTSRDGK